MLNNYISTVPILAGSGGGGVVLPDELQLCEYVETDGNCYIKTAVKYHYACDFHIKFTAPTGEYNVFGNYRTKSPNGRAFIGYKNNDSQFCFLMAEGGSQPTQKVPSEYENLVVDIVSRKMTISDFDGNSLKTYNWYNYNAQLYDYYCLFAGNNNNNIEEPSINGTRIYYNAIYGRAEFYPCYIKDGYEYIDNKGVSQPAQIAGFYDVINNVFYTNDGEGQLTHS